MALLDSLGLVGVDGGEFAGRRIERLCGNRRLTPQSSTAFAPLGHCSILFAARVAGLFMANIASQKKRIARSERERLENLRFRSSVKTHFRRLEAAVQAGDATAVSAEHKALVSRIDKAIQKGALHRNTGARKKARAAGIAGAASQSQSKS
jgi:small subunit ribosomal protein S20